MSKGTIVSHDGDGLYTIELDHSQAAYEAEATRLSGLIAQNNADANSAYTTLAAAEVQLKLARDRESVAIASGDEAEIKLKTADVIEKTADVQGKQEKYNQFKMAGVSLSNRLGILQNIYTGEPEQVQAWCADYNLSLSGDVGVIEVAYDDRITPIIRPGGEAGGEADYNASTDGKLSPIQMLTADSAYNSFALQTGYAKHKPRYRKGEIVSVDLVADTAVVTLDAVTFTTSETIIDLNQTAQVTADIVYMSCNAAVFEAGDRVVVAFSGDWDTPQVIGFESNPKICEGTDLVVISVNLTGAGLDFCVIDTVAFELRERITCISSISGIPFGKPPVGDIINNRWDKFYFLGTNGSPGYPGAEYALVQYTGDTEVSQQYYDSDPTAVPYNFARGVSVADDTYTYVIGTVVEDYEIGETWTWDSLFQKRSKAGGLIASESYATGTDANYTNARKFHHARHNTNYIMAIMEYPSHFEGYEPSYIENVVISKSDGSIVANFDSDLQFYDGDGMTNPEAELWAIACSDDFYCCVVFKSDAPADIKNYLYVWDSSFSYLGKFDLGEDWKSIPDAPATYTGTKGDWDMNFSIDFDDGKLKCITYNLLDKSNFSPAKTYNQAYVGWKTYTLAADGTPSLASSSNFASFDAGGGITNFYQKTWFVNYTELT